MTPGNGRLWLPAALLLLQVPGCWSLHGPTSVTGTVGGSLSVQCQYEEKFKENVKYWCKTPCMGDIMKTEKADKEVRSGRVSIRDHPANLTFTVTLENLTEGDGGTYRCGIDTSWLPEYLLDLTFRVVLSVTPDPAFLCCHRGRDLAKSCRAIGEIRGAEPGLVFVPQRLGVVSIHFLLLILLKVPLFLMMLSVILWVNRSQWAICGTQSQPDEDNMQPYLSIDILSRDTATHTRSGRTSGPKPSISSHLVPQNW
uniref:Ig-like domain-containing protein n=1 Tax=Neovison vison TaxID=452646 RepID=A0A8C7ATH3_NEOVI